ncbi:hypothetical protein [Paenibacillus gansuensis]|uniref:Uncharacterized protein n=1 Tax=Paenibacillus gansuensis TaxID=306542 RepID=A0ABW5PL53_9BACL
MSNRTNRNQEPMIKLQPGGSAPVLSYNVPEPTTYSGRNFIDLQFSDDYFMQAGPSGAQHLASNAAANLPSVSLQP